MNDKILITIEQEYFNALKKAKDEQDENSLTIILGTNTVGNFLTFYYNIPTDNPSFPEEFNSKLEEYKEIIKRQIKYSDEKILELLEPKIEKKIDDIKPNFFKYILNYFK